MTTRASTCLEMEFKSNYSSDGTTALWPLVSELRAEMQELREFIKVSFTS